MVRVVKNADAIGDQVLQRVERGCQRLIQENQMKILAAFFNALSNSKNTGESFDDKLSQKLQIYGLINESKQRDLNRVALAGLHKKENGAFEWTAPAEPIASYYARPSSRLITAGRLKSGL